MFLFIYV